MKLLVQVTLLSAILFITGCSSQKNSVDIDKKNASIANSELGVAYLTRGQYKVAMKKLKKAVDYDETNANAHHYIAELYRRLEQNELAEKHFTQLN